MLQHYVMPVGVDDFRRVRQEYYYVDKTDFIKTLIDGHAQATLITRPRRFGKTLALSTLYYFFTVNEALENRELFAGCKIEQAGERYMREQGTKPVVFLSLKDIKEDTMEGMLAGFGEAMRKVYYDFKFLLDGEILIPSEKDVFRAVLSGKAERIDLQYSLSNLTAYLSRYYGKPVLVLIDEYDAPVQYAWDYGYYDKAIVFVRNYLSSVLKSNPQLDFAVLTGVLRIAKESIFSSLNNLEVASVFSGGYVDAMGFTYGEIGQMAADFGAEDKLPEIKAWYDGYSFAGQEIYNPWSVISYFRQKCRPDAYWVNTSGNAILRHLLGNAKASQVRDMNELLQGKRVRTRLVEGVIHNDIGESTSSLYSILLNTGYLTLAENYDPSTGERAVLRIPNLEIRLLFRREVMHYLEKAGSDENLLVTITEALMEGCGADFAESLENFLRFSVSFYDTANKESFYHGLMLGLLAALLPRFEVLSNRESGYGRFDIAIFPKKERTAGAILEFKVAEKEEELQAKACEALAQIEEKDYLAEFARREVQEVWRYGIAFWGKKCLIVTG